MLEALISLRRNGESELKKKGYIIAVKLEGSPWGSKETAIHQVIEWEDDELEERLLKMRDNGEPHPVITLPYAEIEEIDDDIETQNVKSFGKVLVNVDAVEGITDADVATRFKINRFQIGGKMASLKRDIDDQTKDAGKLPIELVRKIINDNRTIKKPFKRNK